MEDALCCYLQRRQKEAGLSDIQAAYGTASCRKYLRGDGVFLADMEHTGDILDMLTELRRLREWNLLFDRGELIRPEDIESLETRPLKYPAELETQVKKAAAAEDGEEIKRCYYRLYDIFRRGIYSRRRLKNA